MYTLTFTTFNCNCVFNFTYVSVGGCIIIMMRLIIFAIVVTAVAAYPLGYGGFHGNNYLGGGYLYGGFDGGLGVRNIAGLAVYRGGTGQHFFNDKTIVP